MAIGIHLVSKEQPLLMRLIVLIYSSTSQLKAQVWMEYWAGPGSAPSDFENWYKRSSNQNKDRQRRRGASVLAARFLRPAE